MGTSRNVDMSATQDTIKIVTPVTDTEMESQTEDSTADDNVESATPVEAPKVVKVKRGRSKKYMKTRSQVDKTKLYDPFSAIELIKKLSYSKFSGSLEAHGVIRTEGTSVEVSFPHSTGKVVRVAVVSDELLSQIEAGVIEFDMLVSSPQYMGKLAKFARLLGPRGLMPNPRNNTVTDDPEKRKKELESGKTTVKSEKKAPLIHVSIGKLNQDTKELVENLQTLIKSFKGELLKLSLSGSMSPGVKVSLENKEAA